MEIKFIWKILPEFIKVKLLKINYNIFYEISFSINLLITYFLIKELRKGIIFSSDDWSVA